MLLEGERTFKISAANLRSFCQKNLQKVEKHASGKACKVLGDAYRAREKSAGYF